MVVVESTDSMVAVEVRTVWWLWRYGQYGGCGGTDSMVAVDVRGSTKRGWPPE